MLNIAPRIVMPQNWNSQWWQWNKFKFDGFDIIYCGIGIGYNVLGGNKDNVPLEATKGGHGKCRKARFSRAKESYGIDPGCVALVLAKPEEHPLLGGMEKVEPVLGFEDMKLWQEPSVLRQG
ncbi:hypothetical protein IV203_027529 [Nitzschia inconspicua]|uniref:Uncharacterized protein n=1 Tax=Nitzschia inconspicua TaxID=303405 RepID=A0A9K3K4N1_9STRA|nr:hypothetical protein IV203_024846 [Nitzschia inconspicua]KAG7369783.1 hypothetical protein IV203_027529 [Nitzschia inconspicua]